MLFKNVIYFIFQKTIQRAQISSCAVFSAYFVIDGGQQRVVLNPILVYSCFPPGAPDFPILSQSGNILV